MTYRALDLLTRGGYAPLVARREPYWRPPVPKPARYVHLPAWDWESATVGDSGDEMIDLDVSGAFVAALSSGDFAHGALTHTGPGDYDRLRPGYYQIFTPVWQVPGIVSPLGSATSAAAVWIAHPTYKLLRDLADTGVCDYPAIQDSYTAEVSCRLRKWAEKMRDDRAAVLATRAATTPGTVAEAAANKAYKDMKDGYSMAVQMMMGADVDGKQQAVKSNVLRPDWYHTVHAQHAATMWRKIWRAHQAGFLPFGMSSTDEVTYTRDDWYKIQQMTPQPFRIDPTGVALGSFKVKDQWVMD